MTRPLAIVTGANRGIGFGVAQYFAQSGYDVALLGRDERALQQAAEQIKETALDPIEIGVFAVDITDTSGIQKTVDHIFQAHGRVDVLFNNAGILIRGTSDMNPSDAAHMITVNVTGAIHIANCVAQHMKQQKFGYIFNVSSLAGKQAMSDYGVYSATKFAVLGYSEALFAEMLPYNVRVTALCPSYVNTDMTAGMLPELNQSKIQVNDIVRTVDYCVNTAETVHLRDIDLHAYLGAAE